MATEYKTRRIINNNRNMKPTMIIFWDKGFPLSYQVLTLKHKSNGNKLKVDPGRGKGDIEDTRANRKRAHNEVNARADYCVVSEW